MTIESYLKGLVGVDVTDEAIASILAKRDIDSGEELSEISIRLRDLCTADLYMWCVSLPSIKGTVKDGDGGWSHSEGGTQVSASDKRHWRKMAYDLYKRYGEYVPSSINFVMKGMKLW